MKSYGAIAVPLDGSRIALKGLGVATWLASRLGARLHVLSVDSPKPSEEALRELGVPAKYWALLDFHRLSGDAAAEILAAERRYGIDLIVMTAWGAGGRETAGPGREVGHVARTVIEQTRSPVVLLPPNYKESLPWRSALVPLSGEVGTDESLAVALKLAGALDLSVTVAHVATAEDASSPPGAPLYPDASYHEYPHLLNELVERACPLCTAEERRRIEDFCLLHGDVAEELLALIERKQTSLLVVGWHGRFARGRAAVLKALIVRLTCPLLLVKPAPRETFRLKVGEDSVQETRPTGTGNLREAPTEDDRR